MTRRQDENETRWQPSESNQEDGHWTDISPRLALIAQVEKISYDLQLDCLEIYRLRKNGGNALMDQRVNLSAAVNHSSLFNKLPSFLSQSNNIFTSHVYFTDLQKNVRFLCLFVLFLK